MSLKQLDVPHWAQSMVANYRHSQNLPAEVTDRMIYARLEECGAMDPADIEEAVGQLRDEVKDE